MKTIIYVDVLLVINLLITYILLLLTCAVLKMYAQKMRLLIGSILGAVYSLIVLAPEMGFLVSLILKLFMCISIVCVTFQLKSIRIIIRFCICFFAVNVAFSGSLLLLANTINTSFIYVRNAYVYMNFNFPMLLVMIVVSYVVMKFMIKLFQRSPSNEIYRVRIYIDGLYVETAAVADNGNTLYEPISGKPVSILCRDVILPLLPKNVQIFVEGDLTPLKTFEQGWETRVAVICAQFAVGGSLLPTVKVDMIEIIQAKNSIKHENCVIALTKNTFDEMNCQMLLHPSLICMPIEQEGLYENNNA